MTDALGPADDLSWASPGLALGGRLADGAPARLAREHGIRRVVDVRVEARDDEALLRAHGIELLHLPTRDLCAVSPAMLDRGVAWVDDQLARGERVYVHCEHGIGRSALLVCCVLVGRGHSPLSALRAAKAGRAKVCPNPEQLHALLDWAAARSARAGAPPPSDTWHDLARVAYRGLPGHEAD